MDPNLVPLQVRGGTAGGDESGPRGVKKIKIKLKGFFSLLKNIEILHFTKQNCFLGGDSEAVVRF